MKTSYLNLFLIILIVGSLIQIISRGLVAIKEENNGKSVLNTIKISGETNLLDVAVRHGPKLSLPL